ncbi:MAG: hypothetical protein WAV40_04675 [Microgenomates group bacterium]
MNKNVYIVLLVVLVAGAAFLKFKPNMKEEVAENKAGTQEVRKTLPQKPVAGDKLADSAVAKFAFKVAPGQLSPEAKIALIGWAIDSKSQADGSLLVTLTPNKADDQKVSYTVASGDSLYFVEMSAGDDDESSNYDSRLQDDYGLIVGADGMIK